MSRSLAKMFSMGKPQPAAQAAVPVTGSIFDSAPHASTAVSPRQDESIHGIVKTLAAKSGGAATKIAPGIAREVLAQCTFSGQRKIAPKRLARHARRIRTGLWNPDLSTITFAETPDGRLHCINGHHRLHAIVETGIVTASHLVIAKASTLPDVGRMYASLDSPDESRNDNEMLDGIGVNTQLGLRRDIGRALFKAMALILNDLEPMGPRDSSADARDRETRLASMPEWAAEAKVFSDIALKASPAIHRCLLTQGAMSCALYTLRHQPKIAADFWNGLALNDGLRRVDPRACLLADFVNRSVNSGNIRQKVQRIAVAWNAFYEGRELRIIKCIEGAPISFRGTPKIGGPR